MIFPSFRASAMTSVLLLGLSAASAPAFAQVNFKEKFLSVINQACDAGEVSSCMQGVELYYEEEVSIESYVQFGSKACDLGERTICSELAYAYDPAGPYDGFEADMITHRGYLMKSCDLGETLDCGTLTALINATAAAATAQAAVAAEAVIPAETETEIASAVNVLETAGEESLDVELGIESEGVASVEAELVTAVSAGEDGVSTELSVEKTSEFVTESTLEPFLVGAEIVPDTLAVDEAAAPSIP